MKTVPHSPFPVARRLLLSACCLILAAHTASAATMATQPWVRSYVATNDAARALAYGTPTRWTDATGCVWEVETDTHASWDADIYNPDLWDSHEATYAWDETSYNWWSLVGAVGNDNLRYGNGTWWLSSSILSGDYYCSGDEYATRLVFTRGDDSFVFTRSILVTNLVGRVALTNDLPDTAAIANDIADLRTESALVYRLYSGSNVVAEVTNYNSRVHAPELRLMQLNESNEYVTIWAEANGLARTLAKANEYTDGAITNRAAPRAWSKVTAGMGFEAPSNTTWLSSGRTVIAGGLEYEKHMTSGGAIWLLESNGMTADFHAQTNNTAFLDLSNADGTPIFRVEKTDSFLVGVHVDSVTVDGNALVCGVNVVASERPLVRVKASLESGEWAKEEDGTPSGESTVIAGLATVTWSGTSGAWTCRIENNAGGGSIFAHMEHLQEGGTKIVNSAPMDVSHGIICKDGVHKVRPVYSNGGNITWEVVP